MIAEAREQGRARVDSSRPFVLIQSDESEQTEELLTTRTARPTCTQRSSSASPSRASSIGSGCTRAARDDALEPAEAEGF